MYVVRTEDRAIYIYLTTFLTANLGCHRRKNFSRHVYSKKKKKNQKNQMAKTESLQEARRSGDGPLIGYKLLKWCR